jgi:hypothetical protein
MKIAWFAPLLLILVILVGTLLVAQSNPVPLIYQPLLPASVKPGHAAFVLGVHGTGFVPGAVVSWNGQALKTRFISRSALRAQVPAAAVARPHTASVTVKNPGSIASNLIYLSVRQPSAGVSTTIDAAGLASGQVAVGDFNNDGRPDISVSADSKNVDVFLNQGGGNFSLVSGSNIISYNLPGNVVADFNNDGNLDLAVGGTDGSVYTWGSIFLGDGKGGLTVTTGAYKGLGSVADMNGDGILDAVTVTFDGSVFYLNVYLGNGDGTFTLKSFVQLKSGYSPGLPVIGDFNGDGKLDVAVTGPDPVAIFLGNGDGTFQNEVDYTVPVQYSPTYAAVADVNGDGKLDIVTTGGSVLLGRGDGTFVVGPVIPIPTVDNNIKVADVNGDGRLDLVTAAITDSAGDLQLNILLGNGDGTFQAPIVFAAGQADGTYSLSAVEVADFNNDGLLDFAVSGGGTNQTGNSTVLLQTAPK